MKTELIPSRTLIAASVLATAAVFSLGGCGGGGGGEDAVSVAAPPAGAAVDAKEQAALQRAQALNADAMGKVKAERAWMQQRQASR